MNQVRQPHDTWELHLDDPAVWTFMHGPWEETPDGELRPPDVGGLEHVAVPHEREYADFTATFRFQMRAPSGGVRLMFRVQDSRRFYALDIPYSGCQSRNRAFFAGIVKADGTPLQRYLHFGIVLGVCPEIERWYEARVEVTGPRFRAWVEGRLVADVEDRDYRTGRLGLMGMSILRHRVPYLRDVRVNGAPVPPCPWVGLTLPEPHWITPCWETDARGYQTSPGILETSPGHLVASIPFSINPGGSGDPGVGDPGADRPRPTLWVRSTDAGRTWSEPEPAPEGLPNGNLSCPFLKQDGAWVCLRSDNDRSPAEALHTYESTDAGRTWTGPHPLRFLDEWPEEIRERHLHLYHSPVRLHDGSLLLTAYSYLRDQEPDQAWCLRSTDDAQTWHPPVLMDHNNSFEVGRWFCRPDFNETALAEIGDGVVVGLSRPEPWPYMFQPRSNDGGVTWEPLAIAPFPGYCVSLTRTASGALVATTRYPYLCARVSWDDGVNWDHGTIIEWAMWANQHALEVEPDVVLVGTMGHILETGQPDTRFLRLRVTREGLRLDP